MLLRKTILKTKNFFNKTLQNFKSFIFGGYKKLTRAPSLKPFSTSINNPKMQQLDNFYREFCEQWDSDGNNVNQKSRVSEKRDTESTESVINSEQRALKNNEGTNMMQEHISVVISSLEEEKDGDCSRRWNKGGQSLERKMKELEMMDVNDEEHVLDIEEVLHYYSLLTSPIYQDLVDKFFKDMYSEFFLPQPLIKSNSINGSIRRLGPLNI